jgi:3-oxoacyl-[acyl-carrier protein] reductase
VDSGNREGELSGLAALVTGGTRGIGLGIAEHLLASGASVMLTSTTADGKSVTAELCARHGPGRARHLVSNVARRAEVAASVDACIAQFGRLDIAVANAGIERGAAFLALSEQDWTDVIDVNLTGAFHTMQLSARQMIGRGGRIVVVASTNATFVESHIASYNASKAGLLGLVRSAALELAPEGITINAVSPGLVATRMTAPLVSHQVHGPEYLTHIPAGRFGTPADIAGAVGYLVSPSASWITGQQIIIDGGQTIGMNIPPETLT